MENARRAAFFFLPKRSGGCAPEAFVVAKQPSAALSVTPTAFWKVEMFLSRCGADAPGKNERIAPRLRLFHYERAYRASTFEITNLSAQKTRYVSGPLKRLSCPSASFLLFLAPVSSSAHYLLQLFPLSDFFLLSNECVLKCSEVQYFPQNILK